MTPLIRFGVDGIPKAQPRPRAFARKFPSGVVAARVYDAGTAEGWKSLIAEAARPHRPAAPLEGPIRLDVDFFFPRPQSLNRKKDPDDEIPHTVKPDRDNLEKALLDCLKTIGVLKDDCQVCCGEVRKFYVRKGGRPGALVTIGLPIAPRPTLREDFAALRQAGGNGWDRVADPSAALGREG